MILDKELVFSDAQAVTASAASTDVVDLGVAGDAYESLWFVSRVDTAASAAGDATVAIAIETSAAEDFGTKTVLYSTAAIGKAALTAGAFPVKVKLPTGCLRYVRAYYTVATGPLLAGKFDAFLTPDVRVS